MKNGLNKTVISICVILVMLVGALAMFLCLRWVKPTGWLLSANGVDPDSILVSDMMKINFLLEKGEIFTPTDIIDSLVSYYHMLISLLVTIIAVLIGFVTFNSFRSRAEYNELMERELETYLKGYEIKLNDSRAIEGDLNRYEALQAWLRRRIHEILRKSRTTVNNLAEDMIASEILSSDEFLDSLTQKVLDRLEPVKSHSTVQEAPGE